MGVPASRSAPRRTKDVQVDPEKVPGWISAMERHPVAGERVYTNEGTGVVVRSFGKTSDGQRMIEVTMDDGRRAPFFAAAANLMVQKEVTIAEKVEKA